MKRIFSVIGVLLIGSELMAQLPPQTVIIKVRKAPKYQEIRIQEKIEAVFQIVEEPATFQGGDINTFRNWVQRNMSYPDTALKYEISGKVIVQFAVNSKGRVVDVKILRGVHQLIDKEVVQTILRSPLWRPGKQGGRPVKQQFVVPVNFSLQ